MIIVKILCFVMLSNCFLAAPIDDTMAIITPTTAGDISAETTTMSDVLQSQSTMKIIAENEISAEIGEIEATNEIQDDNKMTSKEIQDFMVNVDVDERKLESTEDEVKELKPETTTVDVDSTTKVTEIETTELYNDTEEIQMEEFVVDDEDEAEHEMISTQTEGHAEALNRGILRTILSLYFNGSPSYSQSAQSQINQSNPQQSTSESQRYEKFYERSESEEKVIAYDFETKQYVYVDKGDEQQFNEHQTNIKEASMKTPSSITPLTKDFEIEKYRNNDIEKIQSRSSDYSLKSESSDSFLPSESSESACDCKD
ncbi:unnamed protein product [Diamesa tonsa]